MKKILSIIFSIIIILSLISIYFYIEIQPVYNPKNIDKRVGGVLIKIEQGDTSNSVAEKLFAEGLIKNRVLFKLVHQFIYRDFSIKKGSYVFNKPESIFLINSRIIKSDYQLIPIRVLVKEGETNINISKIINRNLSHITVEAFFNKIKDKEGYMFPDTYFISPIATEDEIIMQFEKNRTKRLKNITELDYSKLILASIVEKEVQTTEDMKIVAGIFNNRLKIGMPLQADSTLTYEIGKSSKEITSDDLKMDSKFNSYKNIGLPPSPISNPGLRAIQAVIEPEDTDYLFFLTGEDNKTYFAKTYKEHLQNKKLRGIR